MQNGAKNNAANIGYPPVGTTPLTPPSHSNAQIQTQASAGKNDILIFEESPSLTQTHP